VVPQKVRFALDADLSVIACVGEKREERQAGITHGVVARQMKAIANEAEELVPVWSLRMNLSGRPIPVRWLALSKLKMFTAFFVPGLDEHVSAENC
jgi:hypothetical protein